MQFALVMIVCASIQYYAGKSLVCRENPGGLAWSQTLTGALLSLHDVRPWWLSLLNDGVVHSPDSVGLFCIEYFDF